MVYITQKNDYANQNAVFQEFVTILKKSGCQKLMNSPIFEGIGRDNENFIFLYYDFDLCQNSTHGKVHSNVCCKKTGTKHSSNTLLYFVPVFLKQTLVRRYRFSQYSQKH